MPLLRPRRRARGGAGAAIAGGSVANGDPIRHGEKDGGDDLDARGYTRAFCASRFAGATHLYAYTDKDTRRPVETLTPLAGALGLTIDTSVHRDDVDALAASIAALPSDAVVVVAWEHSVLTDVAAALGVQSAGLPERPV